MPITRPQRTRRKRLKTLADAVDRLLRMDEINPAETRAVARAIEAVKTAIGNFSSYSASGFKYYNANARLYLGGTITIGAGSIASNILTPTVVPTWPDWVLYGHIRFNEQSYAVISQSGDTLLLDGEIENDNYTSITLEQMVVPLPGNFRRRGSIVDKNNFYPVSDVPAGILQSWQDYWEWARSSANPRIFGAVSGEERYMGELLMTIWPPYTTDVVLNMYYERYPDPCETHRFGTGLATVSGTTVTSTVAEFKADHVGSAIMFSTGATNEITKSLSSADLELGQRVITAYTNTTTVEIDETISATGRAYYISDFVDAMPGPMTDALLRLCEYEMIRQSRGDSGRVATRRKEFEEQLLLSMADDARYKDSVDDYEFEGYGVGNVEARPL